MSEPAPSRPGNILRAEREALGVTVREVSETLNLSMAVIEAIEADDYDRLPGPVFARGYVRAYARLLELDPEPLAAQYPRPPEPMPLAPRTAELPVWEWIRQRPELVLSAAGAGLVVLLILLVLWIWPGGDDGAGADAAAASWPVEDGRAGAGRASDPGAPAWPSPLPVDAAEPAFDGVDPAPLAVLAPDADNVRRITDRGNDLLAFTFTDDCWVEIQSSTGARLYGDLGRGGSELVLVGEGPFRILLGYAPGVELAFNGETLPLAPHTRNNVATLVLGQ